jgi:hypothetical protein
MITASAISATRGIKRYMLKSMAIVVNYVFMSSFMVESMLVVVVRI